LRHFHGGRTFQNFSNEKRSVPLYTAQALWGLDSSTATTDGRVLALVRRIWSVRGLPLTPVGASDSGQIEMAQKRDYRTPVQQFKPGPLIGRTVR
jgi:hypothetical protein